MMRREQGFLALSRRVAVRLRGILPRQVRRAAGEAEQGGEVVRHGDNSNSSSSKGRILDDRIVEVGRGNCSIRIPPSLGASQLQDAPMKACRPAAQRRIPYTMDRFYVHQRGQMLLAEGVLDSLIEEAKLVDLIRCIML